MKLAVKLVVILGILGGTGYFGFIGLQSYLRERNKPKWDTADVEKGDVLRTISSTGTVQPVLSVTVGSFVSGPITQIEVDFNDEVKENQLLARVDTRIYDAAVARDKAVLAVRKAEVERVKAQLQQAINNKLRGERLRAKNKDFLSDREMDALKFECQALEASLAVAQASVLQSQATLQNSEANLEFTEIRSPVDGIVLKRSIDPGNTLAAQFQSPELFVVAPDLRKKIHIFASVSEADIGLIKKAKREKRPVNFTVLAYPDELFTGEIEQIRVSSTDVQNVVTYPVVMAAANPDLKLLPGMTATFTFEVDSRTDVLKVPNAALRFFPDDKRLVRKEDQELLDVSRWKSTQESEEEGELTAKERTALRSTKRKRHVWVQEEGQLKAVEVVTGLVENRFTELVSGDLKAGDKLVTGRQEG